MSSLVKLSLYDSASNRYEEPRLKDNKLQVSSDELNSSVIDVKNSVDSLTNQNLTNQNTIIDKLNNIDESLATVNFNGSFGNLLDGNLALEAFGPVVDVSNFKESNFFYLGGIANLTIGWSLDNVDFYPLHDFKDSSVYTIHLNLSGIKYIRLRCEGGPDVDETTPFASVDGQMTVVSQS